MRLCVLKCKYLVILALPLSQRLWNLWMEFWFNIQKLVHFNLHCRTNNNNKPKKGHLNPLHEPYCLEDSPLLHKASSILKYEWRHVSLKEGRRYTCCLVHRQRCTNVHYLWSCSLHMTRRICVESCDRLNSSRKLKDKLTN